MSWYHVHENLVRHAVGYLTLLALMLMAWRMLIQKRRADAVYESVMKRKDEIASYPPHGFYTSLANSSYRDLMDSQVWNIPEDASITGYKIEYKPAAVSDARVPPVYQDAKSWHPDALNVTKQANKPKRDKRGRYTK